MSDTYVNRNDISEQLRLKHQDEALNQEMDVLEHQDVSRVHDVLDVACGTGRWCVKVKKVHPDWQLTGIDINKGVLGFARDQAEAESVEANFIQMNVLEALTFPDASFDLVNARLIMALMKTSAWPGLLAECMRVLRPGGRIILTESESALSNEVRFDEVWRPMCGALQKAGYTFAPDANMLHTCAGIILPKLLKEAGFVQVSHQAFDVDFSTGAEAHEPLLRDFISAFGNGSPFLVKTGVTTAEEIKETQTYLKSLINKDGLIAYWHFLSASGVKL